ncbi:MAG: bifunctional nuclease family protein [Halobacteriaceae archaeon]
MDSVRVATTSEGGVPVVLLGPGSDEPEAEDGEVVPVFIGFDEAVSIARGLDAVDIGRPLTHDLLLDVVEELGGRVDAVVVAAIEDGTYVADLHLDTPRGEVVVDARPSDSLALAARTNARIELAERVYEASREPVGEFEEFADIREVAGL